MKTDNGTAKKIIKEIEDHDDEEGKDFSKSVWKKLTTLEKKQWIDRIIGEKQVKELIEMTHDGKIDWDEIDPVNSYADYLVANLKNCKKIDESAYTELFESYIHNRALVGLANHEEKVKQEEATKAEVKVNNKPEPRGRSRRLQSLFE